MTAPLDDNRPAHILPLGELNFWTWRGYKSALWWWRFWYCRSDKFVDMLYQEPSNSILKSVTSIFIILIYAIPFILMTSSVFHLIVIFIFNRIYPEYERNFLIYESFIYFMYYFSIYSSIFFLVGAFSGLSAFIFYYKQKYNARIYNKKNVTGIRVGLIVGLVGGISGGLAFGVSYGIAGNLFFGNAILPLFHFFCGVCITMVGLNVGTIFSIVSGLLCGAILGIYTNLSVGIVFFLFFVVGSLRIYNDIIHLFLMFPRPRGRFYRFHPAVWDEARGVVYLGLHRLLVDYAAHDFDKASREIERLIDLGPQASEALKAKAILLIRDAAGAALPIVSDTLADLPEGDKGWLAQTRQVKQFAREISALAAQIDQLRQPVVRARAVNDLITRIMAFQGTVSGLRYPLAGELRAAAAKWLEQAQAMRIAAEQAAAGVGATLQLFRAGDPVDRDKEAFVPRYAVVDELAGQALLATGCPGILLYGRRRTGKSSILKAFDGVLPPNLLSRSASLQDPQVVADIGRLCGKLAKMAVDGAGLTENPPANVDLPSLMEILNRADAALAQSGKRLILALDEYERLDGLVGEGRVPLDFLHMLRESIQTHRHLVWLLAGSHHYENLPNVPWTSFLISMRQVDVMMFTDEETRGLLTDPLAFSPLFRNDENRPRFSDEFWGVDAAGEGGIAWIERQSGGWPHLVQLLAERAVEEVNRRAARAFDPAWREIVLKRAVDEGAPVLRELLLGTQENRSDAERDYVAAFADTDAQAAPADRAVRAHLLRREIIERGEDGLWRLRVPLMRRWIEANRDYL